MVLEGVGSPEASGHRVAFASMRVSRNLSSQRFLPACSSEDRRSAETQLVWETQRSKLEGDGHGHQGHIGDEILAKSTQLLCGLLINPYKDP